MHRDTEGLTVGPPVAVRVITESVREVLVARCLARAHGFCQAGLCDDGDRLLGQVGLCDDSSKK